jgi:hypothetical protein
MPNNFRFNKNMQGVKCMNMHTIKEQAKLKRGFFWAVTKLPKVHA